MEVSNHLVEKLVASIAPKLEELAGLAVKAMKMAGNREEAAIFCVIPCVQFDYLISQLQSQTSTLFPGATITSTEDSPTSYIYGIGDQGFITAVSMLVHEERREFYQAPPERGKVKGFFFYRDIILRLEVTPSKTHTH